MLKSIKKFDPKLIIFDSKEDLFAVSILKTYPLITIINLDEISSSRAIQMIEVLNKKSGFAKQALPR